MLSNLIFIVKKGRALKFLAADPAKLQSKQRKKTTYKAASLKEFKAAKTANALESLNMCAVSV